MVRRNEREAINNLKVALRNFERLIDEHVVVDYGESNEKDFAQILSKFIPRLEFLIKEAEYFTKDVIVIQKPYFGYKHNRDEINVKIVPMIFEVERKASSITRDEWDAFIDRNALLYLLTLISNKKSGYLNSKDGGKRILMFIHFREKLQKYFRRYQSTDAYWYISKTMEEKGFVEYTRSPRTGYGYDSARHYAMTEKGKKYLAKNSFDELAEKMIEIINYILEIK